MLDSFDINSKEPFVDISAIDWFNKPLKPLEKQKFSDNDKISARQKKRTPFYKKIPPLLDTSVPEWFDNEKPAEPVDLKKMRLKIKVRNIFVALFFIIVILWFLFG